MLETAQLCCDLSCRNAPLRLYAKQDDKDSRFVKASFTYAGEAVDLTDVSRSEIRVQKPDGGLTVNEGQTPADGAIIFPLTQQSLAAPGLALVDFVLYGEDGTVISAVPAAMTVAAAAVGDESIVSTDEYTAFTEEFAALKSSWETFRNETYPSQMSQMYQGITVLNTRLGGLTFKALTAAEYAALTPDESTVYYVTDEKGKVTQYLGAVELSGGSKPAEAVLASEGYSGEASYTSYYTEGAVGETGTAEETQ